jgi:chromosomal replication initiation ATPase DnaA
MNSDQKIKGVPTSVQSIIKEAEERIYEVLKRPVNVYYTLKIHNITNDIIIAAICQEFNLTWSDIIKKNKEHPVLIARQLYVWLVRNYTGKTTNEIGRRLGRDYATALNSMKKVNEMIQSGDALYLIPLQNIEKKILGAFAE